MTFAVFLIRIVLLVCWNIPTMLERVRSVPSDESISITE